MAAIAGYFDRKPSSAIRPGLSSIQQARGPSSPQTPQRPINSAFNSPSLSYRAEEDSLIFEIGCRHVVSGFAGESSPRCTYVFGPEKSRRVGDYRPWLPEYRKPRQTRKSNCDWSSEYELWQMDLRDCDLGCFEDKLERAVREAHSKYFLQDCRSRRVILILPSVLPHFILSSTLSVFFSNFQNPSISLFPSAALSTVSAGCRSALVVDIGWRETIMTAIDDYKEIMQKRTERAMRRLTLETARLLKKKAPKFSSQSSVEKGGEDLGDADMKVCEEIAGRLSMCKLRADSNITPTTTAQSKPIECDQLSQQSNESTFAVPSPTPPHPMLQIPLSTFTETAEITFFTLSQDIHDIDDHEQPLHHLLFKTLLSLPPDIRGTCMSRIIITGGGSHIPGLKTRLLQELSSMLATRGWDPVVGKAHEQHRRRLCENDGNRQNLPKIPIVKEGESCPTNILFDVHHQEGLDPIWQRPLPRHPEKTVGMPSEVPPPAQKNKDSAASQEPQVQDEITNMLERDRSKGNKPRISGQIRCVETLGAWAGASLLSSLKVKGVVEIERDVFLQYGMAGARKDGDATGGGGDASKTKRQSMGPAAAARIDMGERKSWTLGIWA